MSKVSILLTNLTELDDFISSIHEIKEVKAGEVILGIKPSKEGDFIYYRGDKSQLEKFSKELKKRGYSFSHSSKGIMFLKNRSGDIEKPTIVFKLNKGEEGDSYEEKVKNMGLGKDWNTGQRE